MQLCVVVPTLNAETTISAQLDALSRQDWHGGWEVLVADNGSTDRTLEVVESYRLRMSNLRVVDASDRKGAAHARNVGARSTQAELVAFVDADDVVDEGWVQATAEAVSRHGFIAPRFENRRLNTTSWVQRLSRGSTQTTGLQRSPYPPKMPHAGGSGLAIRPWSTTRWAGSTSR